MIIGQEKKVIVENGSSFQQVHPYNLQLNIKAEIIVIAENDDTTNKWHDVPVSESNDTDITNTTDTLNTTNTSNKLICDIKNDDGNFIDTEYNDINENIHPKRNQNLEKPYQMRQKCGLVLPK